MGRENPSELALEFKAKATELTAMLDKLSKMDSVDKHWLAISRTNLQQSQLAAARAVS